MSQDINECVLCGDEIEVQANGWSHGHNAVSYTHLTLPTILRV